MPRPLRIEYQGAIYHVVNCGDHREEIFLDGATASAHLHIGRGLPETEWQGHACCLMRNRFHLVIETSKPSGRGTAETSADAT
jgi:hypothetical protein